jgi:hypothetical protein
VRAPRVIGLAVLAAGVAANPAAAAWTEPAVVAGTPAFPRVTGETFTRDGSAFAAWIAGQQQVVLRPGGSAPEPLPGILATPPVPVDRSAVGLVTIKPPRYAYARATSALRFRRLKISGVARAAALTGLSSGRVAIAWVEDRSTPRPGGNVGGSMRVRLAMARRGGRISRPRTIARTSQFGLGWTLAIARDHTGGLLITYTAGRDPELLSVVARAVSRRGRLGRAQVLGPAEPSFGTDLHAATAADGRAVVAWGTRAPEECGGKAHKQVYAAVRPADARRFRKARLLGAGVASCEGHNVGLVAGARVFVGWSQWEPAHRRLVHVAEIGPRGRIQSDQAVGTGDFGGLAEEPDGTAFVGWDDAADDLSWFDGPAGTSAGQVMAAIRGVNDASFGAAMPVSADDEDAGPPALALDPQTSAVSALWATWRPEDGGTITRSVYNAP